MAMLFRQMKYKNLSFHLHVSVCQTVAGSLRYGPQSKVLFHLRVREPQPTFVLNTKVVLVQS